jgi:hypothetical protein
VAIVLDERAVRDALAPCLDDAGFVRALQNLVSDRLCLSLFLMGVSYGEGLGEAGVAAIALDDVASLIHDLRRQQLEEHGHMTGTRLVVEELFPEHFAGGTYRYEHAVFGREYYLTVREANRARLRALDRYSRLNLFLTTSFGYEVMVDLLYGAVLGALARSPLPPPLVERVGFVLTMILRQEQTHVDLMTQHEALLAADRTRLSPAAVDALDRLARLTADDYRWAAQRAVEEIVPTMRAYADLEAVHARAAAES